MTRARGVCDPGGGVGSELVPGGAEHREVSSRSASRSGVAGWPPGCSAAAWKVRAASTSSDARCWRGPGWCMPPIVVAGSVSAHGAQCPKRTRVAPISKRESNGCEPDRCREGRARQRVPRLARQLGWLRPAGDLNSQVQTAGGSLAGNEHSLIASILSARSGPAVHCAGPGRLSALRRLIRASAGPLAPPLACSQPRGCGARSPWGAPCTQRIRILTGI